MDGRQNREVSSVSYEPITIAVNNTKNLRTRTETAAPENLGDFGIKIRSVAFMLFFPMDVHDLWPFAPPSCLLLNG